jgi:CRP-like cAMP-binding protein
LAWAEPRGWRISTRSRCGCPAWLRASAAAYFLLDGRTVASRSEGGAERVLEIHSAGDFFGEIAALTNMPRTANVVAEQQTTLLQVPAPALRRLTSDPQLNRLFLSRMTERMARMGMVELPRFAGLDQASLRELRTPDVSRNVERLIVLLYRIVMN